MPHVNENAETVVNEYIASFDFELLRYERTGRVEVEASGNVYFRICLKLNPLFRSLSMVATSIRSTKSTAFFASGVK
jgi:hypothetical protein